MSSDLKTFRPSTEKRHSDLGKEWDELADMRHDQLSSETDVTFSKVISPIILEFLVNECPQSVLDIGCGTGVLTEKIAKAGSSVKGIDISAKSIEIARKTQKENVRFDVISLEEYSKNENQKYDAAVANMVLMNVHNIDTFLMSANNILKHNGIFIFSIIHPCFWPRFCGYEMNEWFRYDKNTPIEGPFMISSEPDRVGRSTHVHRPISDYLNSFFTAGFICEKIYEPLPSVEVENLYPKKWDFPRYIVGLLRKMKQIKNVGIQ